MLGIERNTVADTQQDRQKGLVRCIKDRFSGKGTGQTISFVYDLDTGLWHETEETWDSVAGKEEVNENEDF